VLLADDETLVEMNNENEQEKEITQIEIIMIISAKCIKYGGCRSSMHKWISIIFHFQSADEKSNLYLLRACR
jgi:hypothetical protein